MTGLVNGTSYRFQVKATNAAGTGAPAALSAPIVVGTPTAPRSLAVSFPAAGQARVSWLAPSSVGGGPVTGYRVRFSSNGGVNWGIWTGRGLNLFVLKTGLAKTHTYQVQVQALNASGGGVLATQTFTQAK